MKNLIVELSKEEAQVVSEYLFRKACKLKESGLEDSHCYPRLMLAYRKIINAMKTQ